MKVGLFFGSFNPVHIGHMAIANYMVSFTDLDQLWFVISPQNPLKKKESLLDDYQRLDILHKAIDDAGMFRICDIEFRLPKPSYTIDTLAYLKEKYPAYEFVLIMGSDGLGTFHKWKNHEFIGDNYKRYIYPRPGIDQSVISKLTNCTIIDAPLMEISSTFIRQAIKDRKDVRYFLPPGVYEYICELNFYK